MKHLIHRAGKAAFLLMLTVATLVLVAGIAQAMPPQEDVTPTTEPVATPTPIPTPEVNDYPAIYRWLTDGGCTTFCRLESLSPRDRTAWRWT
ncbi:MAG: hypothetical protein ACP5R2_03245 [Anaerolineae bacterium]